MDLPLKSCPESMRLHVLAVLNGEYAAPVDFDKPPAVLDVGANIGAFTIWAAQRWPGARVTAYEPHPDNAKVWRENCADLVSAGRASLVEAAVTDYDGQAELHDGRNNCGEASLVFRFQTPSRHVRTIAGRNLPRCDVLKIDTEGSERMVLADYRFRTDCNLIMLEYHSEADRDSATMMLAGTHRLCELQSWNSASYGVMKWLKR
jgi:FkbM family methyltransferase